MRIRNFLVHTAACFIPNRERRKAFRRRYRQPDATELLRRRVAVLEETAKRLDDTVQVLEKDRNERLAKHSVSEIGCVPQIKGERNRIIIWEKGVSRELCPGERIAGFTEIVIDGNDNTLELEMPLAAEGQLLGNNRLHMWGNEHVCRIGSMFKFWNNLIDFFYQNGRLVIGKNTSVRDSVISSSDKSQIEIGEECMIAEVTIRGADSHTVYDVATNEVLNIPRKTLRIRDRVWLGERSCILKNAEIAEGCIVGAEAVVAKTFDEPNCVIAGNPARVVRTGVTWDRTGPLFYANEGAWKY